jgi:tetratricopeptide (TPR) repeat protein
VIFISYRRDDALPTATRLDADLTSLFGAEAVYRDVTRTRAASPWPAVIEEKARGCTVMLVMIGPRWQTASHETGDRRGFPRLSDPDDWVRREIRFALDEQRVVIPVLLDNTPMPSAGWLTNCGLGELAERQACYLRSSDYPTDLDQLVREVLYYCPYLARDVVTPLRPKTDPIRVRYGMVPVVPTFFTGRDLELQELDRALGVKATTIATTIVMEGIGGVGKTQLAACYYRRHEAGTRYAIMAWIDGRLDISSQLVHVATALGLEEQANSADTISTLLSWLRTTELTWLIVVDNAVDPDHLGALLNSGGRGWLLITSRYRYWDEYGRSITVNTFPIHTSAELLRQVGRRPGDSSAEALAEHLGGLALALTLAGATCRENAYSFERYLGDLRSQGLGPLQVGRVPAYDRTMTAVWRDSLATATQRAPQAAILLASLSWLDWRNIDRSWLSRGLMSTSFSSDLERTLSALTAYQLTTLTEDTVAITHGIIAAGARTYLTAEQQAISDDLLIRLLNTTLPEHAADLSTVNAAAPAIHHIHSLVTTTAPPYPDQLTEILFRACNQLRDQRDHDRYMAVAAANLADSERLRGPDHADTITARSHLAVSYWLAGRNADAMPIFERVITDRERILGREHPDTLLARANLAVSYHQAGRAADAIPILEKVVADRESTQGSDHPRTLTARSQLGASYRDAGRSVEATLTFERLIRDRERVLGPEHPDTITARYELALCYQRTGHDAEAISILERVVADRERILGSDHPHTITARYELALCYQRTGHDAEAISILERVVADRERILGPSHPHTITARASLTQMTESRSSNTDTEP